MIQLAFRPSDRTGSDSTSPLSTSAIAGIAAGSTALLLLILAAAFFVWQRRRREQLPNTNGPNPPAYNASLYSETLQFKHDYTRDTAELGQGHERAEMPGTKQFDHWYRERGRARAGPRESRAAGDGEVQPRLQRVRGRARAGPREGRGAGGWTRAGRDVCPSSDPGGRVCWRAGASSGAIYSSSCSGGGGAAGAQLSVVLGVASWLGRVGFRLCGVSILRSPDGQQAGVSRGWV